MQPFVRVSGVRKAFSLPATGWLGFLRKPARVDVLRGVSFDVGQGEIFGLLGENGAGKTTTLHVLAALVSPDAGSVTIGGLDACARPAKTRHLVGLCTGADRSFYYRLTLVENLRFFGSLTGLYGRALESKIEEVLDLVDLRQFADRPYGRCSSGTRQRATIARSLIAEPPLVILDEPTRTLDPVHTQAVRRLIKERLVGALGKTVVLATNSLEEAWELCDRIAILKDGRIETIQRPSRRERPRIEELFGPMAACDA
jgi:ABC-type multidrug transport system ATPase subunit